MRPGLGLGPSGRYLLTHKAPRLCNAVANNTSGSQRNLVAFMQPNIPVVISASEKLQEDKEDIGGSRGARGHAPPKALKVPMAPKTESLTKKIIF